MTLRWTDWPLPVLDALRRGVAIPAHPLALDADRKLDARRQRALTRYYVDAGAADRESACTRRNSPSARSGSTNRFSSWRCARREWWRAPSS